MTDGHLSADNNRNDNNNNNNNNNDNDYNNNDNNNEYGIDGNLSFFKTRKLLAKRIADREVRIKR